MLVFFQEWLIVANVTALAILIVVGAMGVGYATRKMRKEKNVKSLSILGFLFLALTFFITCIAHVASNT